MTLYEKNIICINQNCPYIDLKNLCSDSFSLVVTKTRNGLLTAVVEDKNGVKSVYLHSKYDPLKEATDFVSGIFNEKAGSSERCYDSTVIIFGIGFGYHLCNIAKLLSKHGRVIAVEPDISFFKKMIQSVDLTDILADERFYFIIGKDADELRIMLVNYFNLFNAHSMTIGCLPSYKVIFEHAYKDFNSAIDAVEQNIDMLSYISYERGSLSVQNFASNVSELKNCADFRFLKGKLSNLPCVIVTAGPSLDKNIDRLHLIKGRAFIICVYTALAPLLRRGITPDVVISMDAKQLIRESEEAKRERYNIPLLHALTSPNELVQKFTGIKILCLTAIDEYMIEVLRKLNKLESNMSENLIKLGGSVACSALDFAVRCGCNPIIFIGLDLAFAENEKTHASGTSYDNTNKNFLKRLQIITVPGINDEQVVSANNMVIYRKWIEKYIALDKSDRIYIDATEGGALIVGTRIETLEDAERMYIGNDSMCPEPAQLFDLPKMFCGEEYKFLLADIDKTLYMYEKFVSELNEKIFDLTRQRESGFECRETLNNIDDYISEKSNELKIFSLLVNHAYIYADKNYVDKSHKYYMNSYEFKMNFYKYLVEIFPSNILTFKACMPINE